MCEFWQSVLAAPVADSIQRQAPPVPEALLVYPNCYLYEQQQRSAAAVFLFAVPLIDVARQHRLFEVEGGDAPWRAPAPLLPDNDSSISVCRALELRIRLLVQLCAEQDAADSFAVQSAYAWLDAHLLMANAIDALGYSPDDHSPELALVLARYSPTHYMALREAELPELTQELERCNLFVGGVDLHKEDHFVDLFSKALPRSYDTKDLVTKVADSAVRNTGFLGFLKVAVAATQLGLYSHASQRAPFAVRYAVYRFFFFELDPQLRSYARTSPTPGTAASVRSLFDLSLIVQRLEEHQRVTGDTSRVEAHYLSYTKSLAHTHETAVTGRKAKAVESTEGVVHRSRKKTLHVAVCVHPATAAAQPATWTDEERMRACALPLPSTWDGAALRARTTLRFDGESADSVCGGLFAANAVARLVSERNCGADVYEQRRAEGLLDADAPASPAAPFAAIDYDAAATTLQLPRDLVVPSEERVQSDALFFEWLTTSAVQFAAPKNVRASARARRKKSDFVFQSTLLLAVREYMVFALRRWCAPLRSAYERMVHWQRWEDELLGAAERFRGDLAETVVTCGALLTDIRPHLALSEYMPQTQFRPHNEPFLSALLHRFALVSRGYQVKVHDEWREPQDLAPVDAVLPRETELLLRYSLHYWQYPRSQPALASELPLEVCSGDANTHHQPADFCIEPVLLAQTGLGVGAAASADSIRASLVERAGFPLEIFHASAGSIEAFGMCRTAYRGSATADEADECVKRYVELLAADSAFQFQLIYAFCRAVDRHLHIRSFPLPRHIVEHQMRALRNQNCMPADARVPPHLLRGLVCMGCARVATFLPPTEQRQSTMAFGNDEIRILTTPSDDEYVFRAMRRRTHPLELSCLTGADSWLQVLNHRARDAPPVYDRYCGTESQAGTPAELEAPETVGLLPLDATEEDAQERARQIFAGTLSADAPPPCDRRMALIGREFDNRAPQMVARGRGRLGELTFADAVWEAVDKRVSALCRGGESFLLMGHSLTNSDPRYARMRFACKSHCSRSETKKGKQSASMLAAEEQQQQPQDDEDDEEAAAVAVDARRARLATKQSRDAHSNAIFAACGRELMREVDYLGRALYYTALDVFKRVVWNAGDFVAICCDCLAATRSADLRAIADRIVCKACYNASRLCSGSVALRTARGESTKTVATAVPSALTSDTLRVAHGAARQTLFSPSYAVLCNEVVNSGTVCALDRCTTVKSSETLFYGLEVLCDTDIGNEAFGFIYFCSTHARLYRALFNSTTRLPLSTVRYFMADSKRFAGNVGMHGNFLENVMRGDARATEHQFRSALIKEMDTKKRGAVQKRRAQRKQAIAAGARDTQAQERAATARQLASSAAAAAADDNDWID